MRCGERATDPGKGPSRWAIAVVTGEQILVCPRCQDEDPAWSERAEACPACGSKRLRKALGDKVCRACGHQWSEDVFSLD
jgi:ribosomal protein L40E